jgi:uncharacterized protein (DUF2336 family)
MDASVRQAIAENPNSPRQADGLLARDADQEVRTKLARKVAALTPGLDQERRESVRKITIGVLETLAKDQIARVRASLAEAIKDVPSAPPEVVSRVIEVLARDKDLDVAGPVVEHSVLLSDEVLGQIISTPQVAGILPAVSRRSGLSEHLSDAVSGPRMMKRSRLCWPTSRRRSAKKP